MKYKNALAFFPVAALLLAPPAALHAAETKSAKPNIIFILADDLGIGCVSCYGADNFKTPNVDALAQSGLKFEHCYASPLCGPSRALLMTGRYAYHTGMAGNTDGPFLKPANETMMPTVMKPAGYITGMCGKWSQLPLEPGDWGFDEYLRFNGSGKYWNTQKGNQDYTVNGKKTPLLDNEYLPDKMNDFVMDFLQRHQHQPFYLYYALSHVHDEILRTPDSPPGSKNLYYDNVAYMDKLVGKVVAELDRLKLRENTLIIFAGDNGTAVHLAAKCTVNGKPLSGEKGSMLECGALVPCMASWPGKIAAGKTATNLISFADFFPTLASIAGATLPPKLIVDGRGFAPQLLGQDANWPRDWIFVQLGRHWYDREMNWKLNETNGLFDMRGAPFMERMIPDSPEQDPAARAARQRLQAVLDELNPAGGIVQKSGDGSGWSLAHQHKNTPGKTKSGAESQNANGPEE